MKKFLALAFWLTAIPAAAQTHPCDVTPVQNVQLPGIAAVKAQFCWDGKDKDGNPTTMSLAKVFIDTNTTPTWTGAPTLLTPTANAAGQKQYETGTFTVPKGQHSAKVVASNATGDGIPSLPFSFGLVDGVPGQLINLQIAR